MVRKVVSQQKPESTRSAALLVAGFAFVFVGCESSRSPQSADNAEKIVGKWLVTAMDGLEPDKGVTLVFEFTKEGKIASTMSSKDENRVDEGTYEVTGDKIVYQKKGFKDPGELKIKVLTADTMVVVDVGTNSEMEMRRK